MHHQKFTKSVTRHTVTLSAEDMRQALYEYGLKKIGVDPLVTRNREEPYFQAIADAGPHGSTVKFWGALSACSAVQLCFEEETCGPVESTGTMP